MVALSKCITSNENKFKLSETPTITASDGFTSWCYQSFKNQIIYISCKLVLATAKKVAGYGINIQNSRW
jgi:hypothetical protein